MGGNGAGELSATCYYWGLELQMTQKIPIGLIHSSYGGSAVEDWISEDVRRHGPVHVGRRAWSSTFSIGV